MRYTTPRVARRAFLAALPSRRCAACSPGLRDAALCDESGVYGASVGLVYWRKGELESL